MVDQVVLPSYGVYMKLRRVSTFVVYLSSILAWLLLIRFLRVYNIETNGTFMLFAMVIVMVVGGLIWAFTLLGYMVGDIEMRTHYRAAIIVVSVYWLITGLHASLVREVPSNAGVVRMLKDGSIHEQDDKPTLRGYFAPNSIAFRPKFRGTYHKTVLTDAAKNRYRLTVEFQMSRDQASRLMLQLFDTADGDLAKMASAIDDAFSERANDWVDSYDGIPPVGNVEISDDAFFSKITVEKIE